MSWRASFVLRRVSEFFFWVTVSGLYIEATPRTQSNEFP